MQGLGIRFGFDQLQLGVYLGLDHLSDGLRSEICRKCCGMWVPEPRPGDGSTVLSRVDNLWGPGLLVIRPLLCHLLEPCPSTQGNVLREKLSLD